MQPIFYIILVNVWGTAVGLLELNLRVCPNAHLSQIYGRSITSLEYFRNSSPALPPSTQDCCPSKALLGYFSLQDCDLIESLRPVPWNTLVNPLCDKIIAAIDRSWHDARHQLQTLRTPQAQQVDSKELALEDSAPVATASATEYPLENLLVCPLRRRSHWRTCFLALCRWSTPWTLLWHGKPQRIFLPIWRAWYTIVSYLYGTGTHYPITDHLALHLQSRDLTCNRQCSQFTSFSTSYQCSILY